MIIRKPPFVQVIFARFLSADEIDEMRKLAWRTAGWLNYDMMVWDWCNLDESDMRRALELKLAKRLTGKKSYDRDLQTIQRFLDRDPHTAKKTTAEQIAAADRH